MKNRNLDKGKKLNKKELRTITGGLLQCVDLMTGLCRIVGASCAERQCRFVPGPILP